MAISWTTAIVIWVICLGMGAAITSSKNRGAGEGAVLGGLLGIIGVVIALCSSKQLPKAPAGMISVQCPRCNAVQNLPAGEPNFTCWQCHTDSPAPGFEPTLSAEVRRTPPDMRKVRCFKCSTIQFIPKTVAEVSCESCDAQMKIPDTAK